MTDRERELALIGSAIGWGSGRLAGEDGPQALYNSGLDSKLRANGIQANWLAMIESQPRISEYRLSHQAEALPFVVTHAQNLAATVKEALASLQFPVTLGGDHSTAIGHYAGLSSSLAPTERFGIIWMDAHADCNVPETSPSMACHGMALAAVLGYGAPELAQLADVTRVRPENVCLIGTRNLDDGERDFIEHHQIRVFSVTEIEQRGLQSVLDEAVAIATRDTVGFGLTIDLDVVDPCDAPGVAFPEPNGLPALWLTQVLSLLLGHPLLLGIEISEYAPEFDKEQQTARLVSDLLELLARIKLSPP